MKESEQGISNLELKLKGKIYGVAPVQAEGTINNNRFYFRARHDEWSFSVSEDSGFDPEDIQMNEQGKKYGFFKKQTYGNKGGELASYMDFSEAKNIILDCCKEYRNKKSIG